MATLNELWPDYVASDCRRNHSYFASSAFLRTTYHVIAIFNIPMSVFLFYCIAKVTPKRMKNMKWALLFNHFWSTNLDLAFTIFGGPYFFLPAAAGLPIGILGDTPIPTKWVCYWGQSSISRLSIVMLYENRQSQISTIRFKMTRNSTRISVFGSIAIFYFLVLIPFFLDPSDQLELRRIFLKRVPCPTIEFFHPKTYVLLKGGELLPFIAVTSTMFSVTFLTVFYVSHTLINLTCASNSSVSEATKTLQKKFFANVSVQVTIPFVAIIIPISFTLYADHYNYYNQVINNIAMIALGSHGIIAMVAMLCIYKPYRDFTIRLVSGKVDLDQLMSITNNNPSALRSKFGSVSA